MGHQVAPGHGGSGGTWDPQPVLEGHPQVAAGAVGDPVPGPRSQQFLEGGLTEGAELWLEWGNVF